MKHITHIIVQVIQYIILCIHDAGVVLIYAAHYLTPIRPRIVTTEAGCLIIEGVYEEVCGG